MQPPAPAAKAKPQGQQQQQQQQGKRPWVKRKRGADLSPMERLQHAVGGSSSFVYACMHAPFGVGFGRALVPIDPPSIPSID